MDNPAADCIVRVERLGKQVISPEGALVILDDISFAIARGESVAVVGASGSGKSTLLGLLAGLDAPSQRPGVAGRRRSRRAGRGRSRPAAGATGRFRVPVLSTADRTDRAGKCPAAAGTGRPARRPPAGAGVAGAGGTCKARARHYPSQLSGGEQQRVAIARAFAGNPDVLFADEPTGNLDQKTGHRIIELLFALNREQGATLILVTHDPELAAYCDRVLELDDGRLRVTTI